MVNDLVLLHKPYSENFDKQECRIRLQHKGINIKFEIILGNLHEAVLNKDNKKALVFTIREMCEFLKKQKVDDELMLSILLCLNKCIDKLDKKYLKTYVQFVELILDYYKNTSVIIREVSTFVKKIYRDDYSAQVKKRHDVKMSWIFMRYPEYIIEYSKFFKETITDNLKNVIKIDIAKYTTIFHDFPQQAVDILRIFYLTGSSNEYECMLQYSVKHIDVLLQKAPATIKDLVILCTSQNLYKYTKDILDYIVKEGLVYENKRIALIIDLLEIPTLCHNELLISQLIKVFNKWYKVDDFEIIIKALKLSFKISNSMLKERLAYYFIKNYRRIFDFSPKDAIIFLEKMSGMFVESDLENAKRYSLEKLRTLLVKSPESAIRLLNMSEDVMGQPDKYVRMCIDAVLYDNIRLDFGGFNKLLERINMQDLSWSGHFIEKYAYIVLTLPELAIKIAEIYRGSHIAQKYIDIIEELKGNKFVDEEYMEQLLQVWNCI